MVDCPSRAAVTQTLWRPTAAAIASKVSSFCPSTARVFCVASARVISPSFRKETCGNREDASAYCNFFSVLIAAWAFSIPPTFAISALAASRASRFNEPPALMA
jgi:hypothetical protein